MNIKTTSMYVVRAVRQGILLVAVAVGMSGVAQASVIYQQVFGNSTGGWQTTAQLATDWTQWLTYEGYKPTGFAGVGVSPGLGLSSTDSNIGAALTGTASSLTNGMLGAGNVGGATDTMLAYTTALSIDPTAYSQVQFSWLQKSANFAADYTRLVVCVGSKWYMSSTNLMTSSANTETLTLTYTPTASSWYLLANGPTISTSTIPYHTNIESLMTNPATDLSGNITGFGLILNPKSTTTNMLVDTFAVNAVPEPSTYCMLMVGAVALFGVRLSRNRLA